MSRPRLAHIVVALVSAISIAGTASCAFGDDDTADEAASLLQVEIPDSATISQFSINSGRDGTLVDLTYTVPVGEWRSEIDAYPNLDILRKKTPCSVDDCAKRPFYFTATDRIIVEGVGYDRSVTVTPETSTEKAWIAWSSRR